MRSLTLALLAVLTLASSATANTLIHSGPWRVGSNWSAGHRPTVEEEAVIPPGLEVNVDKAATTGPLRDEGHVVGSQQLTVFGAVTLAPGSFDLTGTLDLKGWGTLKAEDTIYYLRIDGNTTLAAPLHVGVLHAYTSSTLATNGFPVVADTESLMYGETFLGVSSWSTGYWLPYPANLGGLIIAQAASITVTPSPGAFRGEGWTYGTLTFAGGGASFGAYTVAGALTINGPTTMEAGRTVRVGSLATDGTVEHPERLSSTGAVIECGCEVPAGLVVEGIEVR